MIIQVTENSFGHIVARPINDRVVAMICAHLAQWKIKNNDASVYLQSDHEISDFIDQFVPKRKRSAVRGGYTERIQVDSWEFAHLYGWDTHTLFGPN